MSEELALVASETFDLAKLVSDVVKPSTAQLRNLRCIKPNECARDEVQDFIYVDLLRKDRCRIFGDQIEIRFPLAKSQMAVFRDILKLQVLNKWSRCKDCKFRYNCPLADQVGDEDEDARIKGVQLIAPATPEDLVAGTEILRLARSLTSAEDWASFLAYLEGESAKSIAEKLGIAPDTVRQRNHRIVQGLRAIVCPRAANPKQKVGTEQMLTNQTTPDNVGE